MNQVYFYRFIVTHVSIITSPQCLNPFMNQVYFYCGLWLLQCEPLAGRLNPFMNQVYFYLTVTNLKMPSVMVLIPL